MTELKEKLEEVIYKIIFTILFVMLIAEVDIMFITLLKTLFEIL